MKLLEHGPHRWFLLEADGQLYLDVNCSHGAVDYPMLIALDEGECRQWRDEGIAGIDRLAEAIHHSAPGARGSTSPYAGRNLTSVLGRQVNAAIAAWRATHSD